MQFTEILLKEHVQNLGRCGDVIKVAPGYARNYLVPRGLGIPATAENKKAMTNRRARLDEEEKAMFAEIDGRLQVLSGVVVKTTGKADESGRLYGSVNAARIAELLVAAGHQVTEKDIRLEKHLKEVGVHPVTVHLHAERSTEIAVEIVAERAEG